MKNIVAAALQQSGPRRLCALLTIVVLLILFVVSPRTEIYNYYQQSANLQRGTEGVPAKSNMLGLNRKYNLMDETDGLGKLKQLFNGFDSKECTAGNKH
jgi:hypothetical protein